MIASCTDVLWARHGVKPKECLPMHMSLIRIDEGQTCILFSIIHYTNALNKSERFIILRQ